MAEPNRGPGCEGETWWLNHPMWGGWVQVTLTGFLNARARTLARTRYEKQIGRTTKGLVVPTAKGAKPKKAGTGSWSLKGGWRIEQPTHNVHGVRLPWSMVLDSGVAEWSRTKP